MFKAIIYRRKSSEGEEKQVASLDSQNAAIYDSVLKGGEYETVGDYAESMSAKAPGRPLFNEMCSRLEQGEAEVIVCWALNRLARNSVDGGRIIWLVQKGLKIVTPGKIYGLEDLMLMYVEFGISNVFINDLSKATKRGIQDKVKLGNFPGLAPLGYLNDTSKPKGQREIIPDPQRFDLIRKMFDMLLTGQHSPISILKTATDEWGLKQRNGRPLSKTQVYRLFTNPFYAGQFEYDGQIHQGSHVALVTPEEFERAKRLMSRKAARPQVTDRHFAFTRLIKCTCGASVSAHERFRKRCAGCGHKFNSEKNMECPKCHDPAPEKTYHFSYYHCTRRVDLNCMQPSVTTDEITDQLGSLLDQISMPQEIMDWAMDVLREQAKEACNDNALILGSLQASLSRVSFQLDNLLEKYLSPNNENGRIISEDEYVTLKEKFRLQRENIKLELDKVSQNQDDWLDKAQDVFNFSARARAKFQSGDLLTKRQIITALSLNLVLDNKKLRWILPKPFGFIVDFKKCMTPVFDRFEPQKDTIISSNFAASQLENSFGGRWTDEFRTTLANYNSSAITSLGIL